MDRYENNSFEARSSCYLVIILSLFLPQFNLLGGIFQTDTLPRVNVLTNAQTLFLYLRQFFYS